MNRRDFFRTLFGTLAALPIVRLFGWPDPPMVDEALSWSDMIKAAMVSSLTDWDSGYVEVGSLEEFDRLGVNPHWTIVSPPTGMYAVGVDCAAIDDDCTSITVYGSDGRRAVTYDSGLTWTELDATD